MIFVLVQEFESHAGLQMKCFILCLILCNFVLFILYFILYLILYLAIPDSSDCIYICSMHYPPPPPPHTLNFNHDKSADKQ